MLKRVTDFMPIFSDSNDNCATIIEYENDLQGPAYPIYLSAQILANSRVYMSQVMRACNAYLDPKRAMYYTDTDSLVLPADAIPDLRRGSYIGSDIGQLSCDLDDAFKNNQFAKIVKGVWAAVKGPYSLVYLTAEGTKLMEKVKMKGITHAYSKFPHNEEVEIQQDQLQEKDLPMKKVLEIMEWVANPYLFKVPSNIVSDRFYLYKTPSGNKFVRHFNYELICAMMKKEGQLYSFFGGMKRQFNSGSDHWLEIKVFIYISIGSITASIR